MKNHPNYEKIKHSAQWQGQLKELRTHMILIAVACGIGFLLQIPGVFSRPDFLWQGLGIGAAAVLGLAAVMGLIVGGIYYLNWRRLMAQAAHYRFHTVRLEEPHQGWKNCVYFTISLTNEDGKTVKRDTEAIFTNLICPLEDYLNQTVEVAWNEKTDKVVVIRIL